MRHNWGDFVGGQDIVSLAAPDAGCSAPAARWQRHPGCHSTGELMKEHSMNVTTRSALIGLATMLAGCGTAGKQSDDDYDKYADKHSAFQLIPSAQFEPIDLASLIGGEVRSGAGAGEAKAGQDIDQQFFAFAQKDRDLDKLGQSRRTAIQERILAASDQRCNDFKTLLQKKFANVSFKSGLAATAASLGATIATHLDTSRALSGIAGFASGYRAEYNQAYFANAAVQVVVAGIDSRRRTAYEQILLARKEPLAMYPLEAAVKDAIRYHGLCSTVSGLQEAGEAVRYYNEPGITAATRTLARSKMMIDIQGSTPDEVINKLKRWQEVVPAERYLAGNPLGEHNARQAGEGQAVMDAFAAARAAMGARAAELMVQVADVNKTSKALISDADYATAKSIAVGAAAALDNNCSAPFDAKVSSLVKLHARRAVATPAEAEVLSLQIEQELKSADILKASVNFVAAAHGARAEKLQEAIAARKAAGDVSKDQAVTDALRNYNAFAPVISPQCEVSKLQ
jgi:hypothetical protein